jgi:hypothetical protein
MDGWQIDEWMDAWVYGGVINGWIDGCMGIWRSDK